jgi:small subunit ribosomal protein S8
MVMTKPRFSSNVTDPVADLLTRIRNANLAYKDETVAPVSRLSDSLLKILEHEGYIGGYSREGEGVHQAFRIRLKYGVRRRRAITGLRRISKPGRRIYRGRDELPRCGDHLDVARRDDGQGRCPHGHRRRSARVRVVRDPGRVWG